MFITIVIGFLKNFIFGDNFKNLQNKKVKEHSCVFYPDLLLLIVNICTFELLFAYICECIFLMNDLRVSCIQDSLPLNTSVCIF